MAECEQEGANTDRELWREGGGDGNGMIHVTEQGGIGINIGGTVYTRTLREWHALAKEAVTPQPPAATDALIEEARELADLIDGRHMNAGKPIAGIHPNLTRACNALRDIADALAREREARDLSERQLQAVDDALPPWEPEPGSKVGCIGRVQTIRNLIGDRQRAERAEAQVEALREAHEQITAIKDCCGCEFDLGRAKEIAREALTSLPPPQEKPADPTAVDHGIDGSGDAALQ